MTAIFKREFRAYFYSPLGYVFLSLFYFFAGYYFIYLLTSQSSYLPYVFGNLYYIVMILIPFLTMRLMSEDKKLKTDQLLLTAPTNVGGVVWGKYLAAFLMFGTGVAITIVFGFIMATFTQLDWNVFLGNLLGLLLIGGALLSVGLFISSLTESQMIAAIATYAAIMLINFLDMIASMLPSNLTFLSNILVGLSFNARYTDMVNGILNPSYLLFFISIVVVFNFLTMRVLEKKRWS